MKLSDITEEDLRKELERRILRSQPPKVERATVSSRWTRFCDLMEAYVESIADSGTDDPRMHTHIWQEACKLALGDNFFEWYHAVFEVEVPPDPMGG